MTTDVADPVEAVAIAPAADPGFLQRHGATIEYILIPGAALAGALVVFGIFVALFGKNPLDLYFYMYYGAFGTWFSWQNTLTRAAPLILTALCTALPAQLGMVIIGGEGALHAGICSLPRVNDIAVGIALMLFGTGLAFYLGKPLIEPTAPRLPAIDFGWWSDIPQLRAALRVNVLFLIGVALAPVLYWAFRTTRWGLLIRTAGESADAARAMGHSVLLIRLRATMVGGFLAGIGGSFLSLFYPGSWNEGLSSGQGITAVALVIFARWDPMLCLWASLAFGGAAALGPALQSVGVTSGYHLFNAAPYILTLLIMIITCSPKRTLTGAPAELSITR